MLPPAVAELNVGSYVAPQGCSTSHLIAIDLAASSLPWKLPLGATPASVAFGQYPVLVAPSGSPVVVFSTSANGVWGVTAE